MKICLPRRALRRTRKSKMKSTVPEGSKKAKKRQKKVRANPHVPARLDTTVASMGGQAEAVINKTFCTQSRDSQQWETWTKKKTEASQSISTGWWFQHLWKIGKSIGMIIPKMWKKTCSKLPTSQSLSPPVSHSQSSDRHGPIQPVGEGPRNPCWLPSQQFGPPLILAKEVVSSH